MNHSHATSAGHGDSLRPLGDDRYCRNCREIALAFDPAAGGPRCRVCDELAEPHP